MATTANSFEPGCPFHHYLANGAIFIVAVVSAAFSLGRWLPYPDIPEAGEKIRYLASRGDQYDTLFMGSSRVNFQVVPTLFDQVLADHGHVTKSFNAGILGMRPPEQVFFLDRVLRLPHHRLRWVLIELTSLEARTPPSRRTSARFVLWHDWPRMMLLGKWMRAEWTALRREAAAAGSDRGKWTDLLEPAAVYLTHVPAFCVSELNLGRASFISERLQVPAANFVRWQKEYPGLGANLDGWMSYAGRETMTPKERSNYERSFDIRLHTPAAQFHDPASDAAVQAMSDAVVRAGATPIFLLPPVTSLSLYYPPPEMAKNMIIWDFSDPHLYPDLFAVESRIDDLHLNTAGARQFTAGLAQRFMELPNP